MFENIHFKESFNLLDLNNNCFLTENEFKFLFKNIGLDEAVEDSKECIHMISTQKDGSINFNAFIAYLVRIAYYTDMKLENNKNKYDELFQSYYVQLIDLNGKLDASKVAEFIKDYNLISTEELNDLIQESALNEKNGIDRDGFFYLIYSGFNFISSIFK